MNRCGIRLDRRGPSRYTPSHLLPVPGLPSRAEHLNSPELQVIWVKRPFRWMRSGSSNRNGYWSPTCEDKKQAVARDVGGRPRERRKEVALGRLITVSLILILGAWGGASEGAAPDDAAAIAIHGDPPAAARAADQVSGSWGAAVQQRHKRVLNSIWPPSIWRPRTLIAISFNPTSRPRSMPTLKELAKAKAVVGLGCGASARHRGWRNWPAAEQPPAAHTGGHRAAAQVPGRLGAGEQPLPTSTDVKQRGRWLLHEAREQLHLGNYDVAQRKVDEAEALDIKWGLFDDTPAKVSEEIKKARPKASAAANAAAASQPHDRQTAKAQAAEARTALNNRQFEQAEAIALEVKGWGLDLRHLRGQSRQDRGRGPGAAPSRQDPQHAVARPIEPGSLRHSRRRSRGS